MRAAVRAYRPHLAAVLAGAMLGALVAGRLESALVCLAVAWVAAAAAGAEIPSRRWFVTLVVGALVAWALNLYLTPGRPLAGRWPVLAGHRATAEGSALGLLLLLRMAGACAGLQGLRAALPGEVAADAIARWLAPLERLHLPVREARGMVALALRFVPLLGAEARRIAREQDLRAGRPVRGPGEWLQRRRAATVPMLVGALERAERVALALEARHYRMGGSAGGVAGGGATGRSAGAWIGIAAGSALAMASLLWRT
jgi:energy-coupling factor transporter transmembrane protein EcfT